MFALYVVLLSTGVQPFLGLLGAAPGYRLVSCGAEEAEAEVAAVLRGWERQTSPVPGARSPFRLAGTATRGSSAQCLLSSGRSPLPLPFLVQREMSGKMLSLVCQHE